MRTNVWEPVGGLNLPKFLLLLIAFLLIATPASATITKVFATEDRAIYNKTYVIPTDGSTPYTLWAGAIILGIILIILSFTTGLYPNGEEGLVSILAWIPLAFALYASFSVDVLQGFGVTSIYDTASEAAQKVPYKDYVLMESHTVYHFDVVAVCLFILLAFAIGNTYRIWISQKRLRKMSGGEM